VTVFPFYFLVAKASSMATIGLAIKANATTIAIDTTIR